MSRHGFVSYLHLLHSVSLKLRMTVCAVTELLSTNEMNDCVFVMIEKRKMERGREGESEREREKKRERESDIYTYIRRGHRAVG
jgi:hypothetical protein